MNILDILYGMSLDEKILYLELYLKKVQKVINASVKDEENDHKELWIEKKYNVSTLKNILKELKEKERIEKNNVK